MNLSSAFRFVITAALFALAILIGWQLWRHYVDSPWTRDGRVKADVVSIAPDVSGLVTEVPVHDNQLVHKGDVLLRIDEERFKLALTQAEAALASARADFQQRARDAERRRKLENDVVSVESRDIAATQASAAAASVQAAQAARDLAKLNLARSVIYAPSDGYVTNLDIYPGDYATAGHAQMAFVDSRSFRVEGYFEETKLPLIDIGDTVDIHMMSGQKLVGHVISGSRAIVDRDNPTSASLLANVNPTFSWVRLAQRMPVRIAIDQMPQGFQLISGQTCTVIVRPNRSMPKSEPVSASSVSPSQKPSAATSAL